MTSESVSGRPFWSGVKSVLSDAEDFLDRYGMGAWITAMVLGFVVFFPIGLALLGYMLWSGRMGCSRRRGREWRRGRGMGATGNAAFDSYREETLRRLEEEREAFESFMERLRKAKDQAEFDQFMSERRAAAADQPSATPS